MNFRCWKFLWNTRAILRFQGLINLSLSADSSFRCFHELLWLLMLSIRTFVVKTTRSSRHFSQMCIVISVHMKRTSMIRCCELKRTFRWKFSLQDMLGLHKGRLWWNCLILLPCLLDFYEFFAGWWAYADQIRLTTTQRVAWNSNLLLKRVLARQGRCLSRLLWLLHSGRCLKGGQWGLSLLCLLLWLPVCFMHSWP